MLKGVCANLNPKKSGRPIDFYSGFRINVCVNLNPKKSRYIYINSGFRKNGHGGGVQFKFIVAFIVASGKPLKGGGVQYEIRDEILKSAPPPPPLPQNMDPPLPLAWQCPPPPMG